VLRPNSALGNSAEGWHLPAGTKIAVTQMQNCLTVMSSDPLVDAVALGPLRLRRCGGPVSASPGRLRARAGIARVEVLIGRGTVLPGPARAALLIRTDGRGRRDSVAGAEDLRFTCDAERCRETPARVALNCNHRLFGDTEAAIGIVRRSREIDFGTKKVQ